MAGAFIISRDIFNNPIWQNNTEFRMFLLILGKAIWKDEGRRIGSVTLKKGQWLRSYRNLQSDMEYIENNVVKKPGIATIKRTVDKLVTDGRITIEQTELGTLFTVVNYCKYQDLNTYKNDGMEQQRNDDGTPAEQQRNNKNKEMKGKKENNIYTPEFENWYFSWPRPEAKADSFKNFEKRRKEHGLDFILKCSRNYINYLDTFQDGQKPYPYQSNNFFGQKAYYLDYVQPKFSDSQKPINPNRAALDRMT